MRFPGDMAGSNIGLMVISGSKSELSEQWRIWLQGFTYQPTPTKSREVREANYFIGLVLECRIFLRILQLFP